MSEYVAKYIDKVIEEENQRRWWTQDPSKYEPVRPDEIKKLLAEDEYRKDAQKGSGRD